MVNFKAIAGGILAIVGAFIILYLRATNRELSEVLLFINFWQYWVVVGIMLLAGYFLISSGDGKDG